MPNATICLNMIVKNESHVLRRCLDSVLPFIDSWVICDTGSTDGTQDLVRQHLKDIPGELHQCAWRDFGYNRSEALQLAKGKADYTLIIDADEVLLVGPNFRMPTLVADEYQIRHEAKDSGTSFYLSQLVRSALPWRYVGVLHEAIVCDATHTTATLEGLTTKGLFDGARNADPQKKYLADAAVLEAAWRNEPDNARTVFYLAQSYRDAGELAKSLEVYERRASMSGWDEEAWYSLYQVAVLRERLAQEPSLIVAAYLHAYQHRPTRAEPLCALARYHRERKQFALAHLFSSAAMQIVRPADILFLDDSVYDWRIIDEYAVSAYWLGRFGDALKAVDRLLSENKLPSSELARVEKNKAFCVQQLAVQAEKACNEDASQ